MPYKEASYYNEAYRRETLKNGQPNHYREGWENSPMRDTWQRIIDEIPPEGILWVMDLGCGTGQFAKMYEEMRPGDYLGIDFSREAFMQCLAKDYRPGFKFICADIHGIMYAAYPASVYVISEVLEHLKDDLKLLDKLNSGTPVIITVPDFAWESHVRHFESEDEVRERYAAAIDIEKINYGKVLPNSKNGNFLIKGILK